MASMQDAQPRRGYADLLSMPDDGRRYEIHGGELVMVPAPIIRSTGPRSTRSVPGRDS